MSDILAATAGGAFGEASIPAFIAATAVYSRTTKRYGRRGLERYVPMDAGGCAENISLQATALGLNTYIIGAFDDSTIGRIIGSTPQEMPIFLMPVGQSADSKKYR